MPITDDEYARVLRHTGADALELLSSAIARRLEQQAWRCY